MIFKKCVVLETRKCGKIALCRAWWPWPPSNAKLTRTLCLPESTAKLSYLAISGKVGAGGGVGEGEGAKATSLRQSQ